MCAYMSIEQCYANFLVVIFHNMGARGEWAVQLHHSGHQDTKHKSLHVYFCMKDKCYFLAFYYVANAKILKNNNIILTNI